MLPVCWIVQREMLYDGSAIGQDIVMMQRNIRLAHGSAKEGETLTLHTLFLYPPTECPPPPLPAPVRYPSS